MGQVRRAPLPDGPHRDLVLRLRELHLDAGRPSVRTIARQTEALGHDTVHRLLVGAKLPSWGPLELVVEALGGHVDEFRELWKSAHRFQETDDE